MTLRDLPRLVIAFSLLPVLAVPATAADPLYVYCSTGDNQWVSDWQPIDSPATVDALFEWLHDTHGVSRMYWRGEQERMWLEYAHFRPENPRYYAWWTDWIRHLTGRVKTDELAIRAARKLGMEIYMHGPLFDHGAQGDAGGCGMFPYATQDKLLIEHPEWRPVDRWGERYAPGPPEFCYPELRRILVDRHVRHAAKYDGISFYTYVENMAQRYMDEFGYNEPIVNEFKRRHGVDIRREPFDREAWNRLRGEYVTQFLVELHDALKARGKKLSMVLRPDQPHLPQRWLAVKDPALPTGAIHMDWEGWVRQGAVDELFVWGVGMSGERLAQQAVDACAGTGVRVVVLCSYPFKDVWQPLKARGLVTASVAAPGYGIDPWAREPTSAETLTSFSWRLRMQTLVDVKAGKLPVAPAAVAARLTDPHVLVRREALRTLAKLKAGDHVAAVESALADRETSVRTAAATALGVIGGPASAERILAGMEKDDGFQYREAAIRSLVAMKDVAVPALAAHAASRRWWVRETVARVMSESTHADARAMLLRSLEDGDYRVRYWAVWGAKRFTDDIALEALFQALGDQTTTVQLRAATALGERATALPPAFGDQVFAALRGLFETYGDGCKRSDAGWGGRVVGMALQRFGERGQKALEGWRDQRQDRWLAWAAYLVLHVPQNPHVALTFTEEEAVATHDKYAPPFPGHRP
jgi:hypothetical protein